MKFVTDLSKGILGNGDSAALWRDIIDRIPESFFLKPNVKILNVCCGHGTEADLIVAKMKSVGVANSDIQNSIYLLDKYRVFTNRANRKGYANVITADFLTWSSPMKFDIVVGNPPYQDGNQGLWKEFANKSYELTKDDGYLAFVTPNSWANGSHLNTKRNVFNNIFQKNKMMYIHTDVNEHFPKIGKNISYWILNKNSNTGHTTVTNGKESVDVDLKDFPFFINMFSPLGLSIFKKVLNKKMFWDNFIEGPSRSQREFAFPKAKHIYYDSFGFKYDGIQENFPTSKAVLGIDCSTYTIDQVKNIKSHFESKLYRFLWKIYGAEGDAASFGWVLRAMPKLDINLRYTDKEIYDYFVFDQSERNFIEQSVNQQP